MQDVKDLSADALVGVYRGLRESISEQEEAFKQEIGRLKEKLEVVSNAILDICNAQNADGIKTANGTVTRRVVQRYWTTDWESMYKFIKEVDAPYLLEQRIHNTNMKQYLEDNPDTLPVGLQIDRKYAITVRKPTATKE